MKKNQKHNHQKEQEKPQNLENLEEKTEDSFENEQTTENKTEESEKQNFSEQEEKYNSLNDNYLRLMAEYDNYRKRTIREKAELIKTAGESVLINILPLIDDFERGMNAAEKTDDINALREGILLIYNKFTAFLKQNGVRVIETEGKDFDTQYHEAITMLPVADEEQKGKIIDCVQKGYMLNDKVIRFAKVVVGQ
jgi:molecular chaperone GrpE